MKHKLRNIIIVAFFPAIISIIAILLFDIPNNSVVVIQIILYGVFSNIFICKKNKKIHKRDSLIALIGLILSTTIICILKINIICINTTLCMIVEICMIVIFCSCIMFLWNSLSNFFSERNTLE